MAIIFSPFFIVDESLINHKLSKHQSIATRLIAARKVHRNCPTKVVPLLGFGAVLTGATPPIPLCHRHTLLPMVFHSPLWDKACFVSLYTRLPQRWELKWRLQRQEVPLYHHHYSHLSLFLHQAGRQATKMSLASVPTSASGLGVRQMHCLRKRESVAVRMDTREATESHIQSHSGRTSILKFPQREKSSGRCPAALTDHLKCNVSNNCTNKIFLKYLKK